MTMKRLLWTIAISTCAVNAACGSADSTSPPKAGAPDAGTDAVALPDASGATADGSGGPAGIGCAAGPDAGGGYNPTIVASDFSTTIDNPYYPIVPGTVQHLTDNLGNIITIEVTTQTVTVLGVTCVVVHDWQTSPSGTLMEDTNDWFAQDKSGNVWYFGEDTKAYGAPGTPPDPSGSWTGGVDCAKPGIVMEAHPQVGDSYRQEFYAARAEDQADVVAIDETVTVPYGTFNHCVKTRDYSALEPGADENKWWCPGLGNVRTVDLPTSLGSHEDLLSITGPGFDGGAGEAGIADAGSD
jgi:hypothetical protein